MSNCNNSNQNCTGNNIYVSGAETRTVIEVSNNKSRYYAELAETYKNKAKEYCDSARYYAEQNSDVSMNYVNNLEAVLRNLINTKQDAGEYALTSALPTTTSDLTNDSGFITSSALSGYATETWVGNQGYITGIDSSDVATALGYAPVKNDLSNLSSTSSTNFDAQWISSSLDVASSVTAKDTTGVLEYSLTSYLPNDNYNYEVIFTAWGHGSASSSGAYCWLFTDLVGEKTSSAIYAAHVFRGNGTAEAGGAVILPVGTGRKLKMYCSNTSNATIAGIRAIAYRRIGTNQ